MSDDAPPELRGIVAPLRADRPTWSDVLIAGGPSGIVAARSAIDGLEASWAFDLWLCERIAGRLALPALPPKRIGPAWTVPYALGRGFKPRR
jgi:hypothetical protein